MTVATIIKELHEYIDVADEKKVKAIYALVEDDITGKKAGDDRWTDTAFVAEMNRRITNIDSGKDKGRSWDEVHKRVRQKSRSK